MAEKKSQSSFIVITVLIFVGLAAAYFFTLIQTEESASELPVIEVVKDSEDTNTGPGVEIDVKAALSNRILGDPNAPIKISEHSSFTCGHCSAFHKETFKQIKEAFIDTGKVYLIFSDFPLNAPALHASMAARCVAHDKYFDFTEMLFETQEDWAFERNYMNLLQKKAAEYGLNKNEFKACIGNEELQEGIAARQSAAQNQWKINSTPSFVINNKTTISGGRPFEEFEKIINEELAKLEGSSP